MHSTFFNRLREQNQVYNKSLKIRKIPSIKILISYNQSDSLIGRYTIPFPEEVPSIVFNRLHDTTSDCLVSCSQSDYQSVYISTSRSVYRLLSFLMIHIIVLNRAENRWFESGRLIQRPQRCMIITSTDIIYNAQRLKKVTSTMKF